MAYRRTKKRSPVRRSRRPSYARPRRTVRRVARPKSKVQRQCSVADLSPAGKFALAQLDPFETKCLGAKIPDSNSIPSISNQDTDIIPMPVGAGLECTAFRPSYTWGYISAVGAASSVSWGASYTTLAQNRQKRTNYLAVAELTRAVAHGVRISSPLAPTIATGFVHVGLATESMYNAATWQFPTTVGEMANLAYYRRVTLASLTQTPLTVINKWIDDTAFRYVDAGWTAGNATAQEIQTDGGWAAILVMVEGGNNSAATLSVEHTLMSEFIPKKDAVIIGTAAAANQPGVLSATTQMIQEQDFVHTEAEQGTYINSGVQAFAQGAAQAGTAVYENVAVPLMNRMGQYVGNTVANGVLNMLAGRGGLPGVNANPNRLLMY